ncbi:MAG: helix-turn-helix domain-containing protein [Aureibaculum sp.]
MKLNFNILIFILALIFLNVRYVHAQERQDGLGEYERLSDSIVKYRDSDNLRLSIDFAKKRLAVAEKEKDTVKIIKTLHFIGRISQFISEIYQSIEYFEKELGLLRKIDLKKKEYKNLAKDKFSEIEVMAQLGQNYALIGQVEKAFSFYDRCLEIAQSQDLAFYKAVMPTIIGDLHYTTGNYKEALAKQKESFNALKNAHDLNEELRIRNMGVVILSMSSTYVQLAELDSALWILDEGIKEKLDKYEFRGKFRYIGQRGWVYLKKEEFERALNYLLEAEKLAIEYDSVIGPSYYSFDLGECYLNLKKYDLAIAKLEAGLEIKKRKTEEINLVEDYKLLAKTYKEAGNIEKSNEYYEKYIINQTAFEKSKDTITSSFHDKEIQDLAKEKSFQKNRFLYVISGISVLVLGLFFVILYLIKERKKNTKKFENLLAKMNVDSEAELQIVDTKDSDLEEKSSADVNEEITKQILNGLEKLKEQEYYLKQECNSYNVAKKIKTNTSYLSKVINSHFQKNFNTYINDLRINYAIVRLKNDSRFRSFSIQSIAEELGYKSADSFTKYFKQDTGLNPSFYIKQLNTLG